MLRYREINTADLLPVAKLLTQGFRRRNFDFWMAALEQLTKHDTPPGLPKYGYLLENDGTAVGVILQIWSKIHEDDSVFIRCNLSSWYVEPQFRTYAPLLIAKTLRHAEATYLNVSPAQHTRPIIETHGFERYSNGIFLALPVVNLLMSAFDSERRGTICDAHEAPKGSFDPMDQELLLRHAGFGCISVWCSTAKAAYPFVFRPGFTKRVIPFVRCIYCRDPADLVRFSGPIGKFLALRGWPFIMIDANAPIPGLFGKFFRDLQPKYFKGPHRPRLGDLAYTESALWED